MKDEIIALEADFSNNGYYGTNVWTEEKYRVISGRTPVLFSAPHAVNQFRGEDVRNAEKYTGALVKFISHATNSFSIFQVFTHQDPNIDEESMYKNAVINLIDNYNIKLFIDVHSSKFKDDADIDIVSHLHETLCGDELLIEKIKLLGLKYNLNIAENNKPNPEKNNEVIAVSSLICGVPSIRLVINEKNLDIKNDDRNFKRICSLLQDLVESERKENVQDE